MPDRFTPEEFKQLMEPWTPAMRELAENRMETNFARETIENFSEVETSTMRAAIRRLIPEDEGIDLVGFMDWAVEKPLGRGDRRPGMPGELELYRLGLLGLDQAAQARSGQDFRAHGGEEQDSVLSAVQNGSAPGAVWQQIPPDYFFERFYAKLLHGYFAHPRVWMRIGFMGASYPEGYTWVTKGQVKQRHERQIGWDRL
jgi:gluconate 2-dehydrogenase gamma chain